MACYVGTNLSKFGKDRYFLFYSDNNVLCKWTFVCLNELFKGLILRIHEYLLYIAWAYCIVQYIIYVFVFIEAVASFRCLSCVSHRIALKT